MVRRSFSLLGGVFSVERNTYIFDIPLSPNPSPLVHLYVLKFLFTGHSPFYDILFERKTSMSETIT